MKKVATEFEGRDTPNRKGFERERDIPRKGNSLLKAPEIIAVVTYSREGKKTRMAGIYLLKGIIETGEIREEISSWIIETLRNFDFIL